MATQRSRVRSPWDPAERKARIEARPDTRRMQELARAIAAHARRLRDPSLVPGSRREALARAYRALQR
jgi:hypothetical protein